MGKLAFIPATVKTIYGQSPVRREKRQAPNQAIPVPAMEPVQARKLDAEWLPLRSPAWAGRANNGQDKKMRAFFLLPLWLH